MNPELIDAMGVCPRMDTLTAMADRLVATGRWDSQSAPIWAEKLRYLYTKVLETVYPELAAANGDVIGIDTRVDPAALVYEYYMITQHGYADWIDDDGQLMASGSMTAKRFTGRMAEMGHRYKINQFDLERARSANVYLPQLKANAAKEYHDRKTNWTWLFGDSEKALPGLCNHPNITISLAAFDAATGSTSRLWSNKTIDDILNDIATLIDTVATNTLRAYHVAKVFMPLSLHQILVKTRLGAGDGFASLLGLIEDRYGKPQSSGQPKVEFRVLNECEASMRKNPKTNTDTSGITGDFLLAVPGNASLDELAFIRARPFTTKPPQERDFDLHHLTHSKVGGCKCTIPLGVHRMDFGLT